MAENDGNEDSGYAKGPPEQESSDGPDVALNAVFRSGTAYFMSLPTSW